MDPLSIKIPMQPLHLEHELWNNEFSFYADELLVLNRFLEDVVHKNTGEDALKGIEHFQNQIIRQKEVLDELVHEIGLNEQALQQIISRSGSGPVDKSILSEHINIREKVETYRKLYAEMKEDFMRFVAKWM